jgi:hypothetical protein
MQLHGGREASKMRVLSVEGLSAEEVAEVAEERNSPGKDAVYESKREGQ